MQATLMGLLSGAALCTIAPVFLHLPKPMAIASLVCGVGLGIATAASAESSKTQEAINAAKQETLLQIMREQIARERSVNQAIARNTALMEYRQWVETNLLPDDQVQALAAFGVKPSWLLASQPVVNTVAHEVPQHAPVEVVHHPHSGYSDLRNRLTEQPQPQQPAHYFDDRDYWADDQSVEPILQPYDVAQGMALYDGHVLVASRTGSGKTTLVQAAIAKAHDHYQGMVDFFIIDPKGAAWLGLENDSDYAFVSSDEDLHLATSMVEKAVKVMQARQQQRMNNGGHWETKPMPVILVIDEYNSLYSRIKSYNKPLSDNFSRGVQHIIFQGREDNVHVWIFSQTTRVGQLGMDTSVQDNMLTIALARNGDYQSLEDAIGNRYVVASDKTRKALNARYEEYKASNPNVAVPVAYYGSNGGAMVQLPDYSQYKYRKLQRLAHNQSTDEILAPEPIETEWIVDAVRRWLVENGQAPTVANIQSAYRAIAGQGINEQGARMIHDEL